MKIGITGAHGVIGKLLLAKLNQFNYEVYPFQGDVRHGESIFSWLSNRFDVIFHLAAKVPVKSVNENPLEAFSVNVGGTINLMEGIKSCEIKPWVFFAGSAHVYKSIDKPVDEHSQIEPITLYGETKWFAERICSITAESIGCPFCCGRIFSFYHESQNKPFIYPTIIERLNKEDLSKPFLLHGADSVRDFLDAAEVVEIMYELMNRKAVGVVNIGSGKGTKIRDFVQQFSNFKLSIKSENNKADFLVADIKRLESIIGKEF